MLWIKAVASSSRCALNQKHKKVPFRVYVCLACREICLFIILLDTGVFQIDILYHQEKSPRIELLGMMNLEPLWNLKLFIASWPWNLAVWQAYSKPAWDFMGHSFWEVFFGRSDKILCVWIHWLCFQAHWTRSPFLCPSLPSFATSSCGGSTISSRSRCQRNCNNWLLGPGTFSKCQPTNPDKLWTNVSNLFCFLRQTALILKSLFWLTRTALSSITMIVLWAWLDRYVETS